MTKIVGELLIQRVIFANIRGQPASHPAGVQFSHNTIYFLIADRRRVCCVCVCDEEGETKKSLSGGKCSGSRRRRCRVADTSATDTLTPRALDLLFFTTKKQQQP